MIKSALIAIILLATVFAGAQSSVREIEFKGLLSQDSLGVKKRFATTLATGASLAEVDEMIRYLFRTNHYDMVEAAEVRVKGKTVLQLIGYPIEVIDEVEVIGEDAVDDDDIGERLEIQVGKRLPKSQMLQLIPAVEDMYRSNGFLNAKVKSEFKELS